MDRPSFLMCPPDYFEIAYEINPWMHTEIKADAGKAKAQWQALYETLTRRLGARVELLEPVQGLPDMVFTANAGLVHKRTFIRANFRHKERRGEETFYEKWFRKKSYKVKTIEKPLHFEGEGDALFMGPELYTGYHFRSDVEAHDAVSGILKMPYFALELADKRFYHLDTCFAPLDEKSALVFLPAFEMYAQMVLIENIPDLIQLPEREALQFACNAIVVGKKAILSEGAPEAKRALENRGYEVYPLDFSEFIKAGGAAKCLVLKL